MSQNLNLTIHKIEHIPQVILVSHNLHLNRVEFEGLVALCEERNLDFTSIETLKKYIESMQHFDTGLKIVLSTAIAGKAKLNTAEKIAKAMHELGANKFYIKLSSYLQQLINQTIVAELSDQQLQAIYDFTLVEPSTVNATSIETIEKYISENLYLDTQILEALSFIFTGSSKLRNKHDISKKAYELGFGVFCARIKSEINAAKLIKMPEYSEVIDEEPGIFHDHTSAKPHNAWLNEDGRGWSPKISYTPFGGLMRNSLKVIIAVIVMAIFCQAVDHFSHALIRWGGVIIKYKGDVTFL